MIENNLREGQLRLIFFMEEAPNELKSIVDFLNSQMERTEVLVVEAKQYQRNGTKIIVPRLFGYTEEARRIKRSVTVKPGYRIQWNEEKFLQQARERLSDDELDAVKRLLEFSKSGAFETRWGTGKETGSSTIVEPAIFSKSIISCFTNGSIVFSLGGLKGNDAIERFRDALAVAVKDKLGFSIPDDYIDRYPSIVPSVWIQEVETLIDTVKNLINGYKASGK